MYNASIEPPGPSKRATPSLRISNIPLTTTRDLLRRVLEGLTVNRENTEPQSKHPRQENIQAISLAPSPSVIDSGRYQVATVTFRRIPAELQGCVSNKSSIKVKLEVEGAEFLPEVDSSFEGLTPLNNPSNPLVDIIAVTGLAGNAFGSWKSRNGTEMWLRDFLPADLESQGLRARVLTYGYDTKLAGSASSAVLRDLANQFLHLVKAARHVESQTSIIFIGHSLGGLVIKTALRQADRQTNDAQSLNILQSCYGILFFGVPNRGLKHPSLISMVEGQPNKSLIQDLQCGSQFLNLLDEEFCHDFMSRDTRIISFYELKETPIVEQNSKTLEWQRSSDKVLMVPYESAVHNAGNEGFDSEAAIDADHSEIVKFPWLVSAVQASINEGHDLSEKGPGFIGGVGGYSWYVTVPVPPTQAGTTASAMESGVIEPSSAGAVTSFTPALVTSSLVPIPRTTLLPAERIREFDQDVEENTRFPGIEGGRSNLGKGRDIPTEYSSYMKEPINKVESTIGGGYTEVTKERRLEILRWMSTVPFHDHHSYASDRRQDKTGIWLLENEKYLAWKLSEVSSLLWLRGNDSAGSGKTILASKVIDEFQRKQDHYHALAYFYCYYKDTDTMNDPARILSALVKQICLAAPAGHLPTLVLSIYERREERGHITGPLKAIESRDLIIELSKAFWQTTIIIDALDECNPKSRRQLFHTLNDLISATDRVKIFVTGRNDDDIQDVFEDSPSHYIDASDNTKDINMYIDAEVGRRCNPRKLRGGEKPLLRGKVELVLEEKILSVLKQKADGMFMWVQLQILALCEEHTPGDVERALDTLPKGLDLTYTQVFERIDSQSKAASSMAREVLKWVLYSRDPSPDTVIQAFAVNVGEATLDIDKLEWTVPHILSICQNLVVVEEKLMTLRFAHFSIQEYLQHRPEFNESEKAHTSIAEICLTVLINQGYEVDANPVSSLYSYFISRWADHVRLSGGGSSVLESLWKGFLKHSLAYNAWATRVKIHDNLWDRGNGILPPLWTACYYQLLDSISFLLEQGADPNLPDRWGQTPLIWAASKNHKGVLQRLLEADRVDLNWASEGGCTALQAAVNLDNRDIVRILVRNGGVDLNCGHIEPLRLAVDGNNKEIVQILLESDAVDVNSMGDMEETPLHWAINKGNVEIVQMLLKKEGVDVNCKDEDGETPLVWAFRQGHKELIYMLLDVDGVDVNCKATQELGYTLKNDTPLLWAAREGHKEIVQLLLSREGVEVNCKDVFDECYSESSDIIHGCTPLLWAIIRGHKEIVEMLVKDDRVDVNDRNDCDDTPLLSATREGHTDIMQLLLSRKGVEVNCKAVVDEFYYWHNIYSDFGGTRLLSAIIRGHKEIVEVLLEDCRVDVNDRNSLDETPLLLAAREGHKEIVQLLLSREGVEVNCKGAVDKSCDHDYMRYGGTPLLSAIIEGHKEIVKVLLNDDRVDGNYKNDNDETPLLCAIHGGDTDIVQMLLEKNGVDMNYTDCNGYTPLLRAVYKGDKDTVNMLLKGGANINWKNRDFVTPLSCAVRQGHTGIAEILLERIEFDLLSDEELLWAASKGHEDIVQMLLGRDKVDVNCTDDLGNTPPLYAASNGHSETVEMLLGGSEVDINCKNQKNQTPLLCAASKGHEGIVQMLLERDDIYGGLEDDEGNTPLLYATREGHQNIARMLLERDDVNVNWPDDLNNTPLLLAASNGDHNLVSLILGKDGIELNWSNREGNTPLLCAASNGHEKIVRILVGIHGVEINGKDLNGDTPLSCASRRGHERVVKILLGTHRADVNYSNWNGDTALSLAKEMGHTRITHILKKAARRPALRPALL